MTFQIVSTNTASLQYGVKAMIYGNSGVGKTRLLASAPAPLILSAERGLLSLRQFNLPAVEINSLAKLNEVYTWLLNRGDGGQFQTIGIDSVSEIGEVVLAEEKKKTKDPRKGYGEMADQLVDLLRRFRELQYRHVVMIAKQEYSSDGATGARYWQPSFPGQKIAQAAPYFVDSVWQLFTLISQTTNKREWWLRTQPDAQNIAKDRSGSLAEYENADPQTGGGLSFLFAKMMRS